MPPIEVIELDPWGNVYLCVYFNCFRIASHTINGTTVCAVHFHEYIAYIKGEETP